MATSHNPQNTLCVCLTPLHVLIAEKVAEAEGQSFDKGIYYSYNRDTKTDHYFKKMSAFCKQTEFVLLPNDNIKSVFKHLLILKQRWLFRFQFSHLSNFKSVFLPTSYNTYLMIIFALTRKLKLSTFDDGILNIAYEEIISPYRNRSIANRIYTALTGIKYTIDDIVSTSQQHFSIYDAKQNVCKNIREINLISNAKTSQTIIETQAIKRIFIGPPPETNAQVWDQVNQKIAEVKPDEFLPHPRDIHQKAKNVHYTQTHLIAEDYVISELEKSPNCMIEVYGLQSTALIHLAKLPNVNVYSFIDEDVKNKFLINLMSNYHVKFV